MEIEKRQDNYCVILAGGHGRRLWPSSRKACPKQFVDFFGTGRTQLQSTFDRMVRIIPRENIFVTTRRRYLALTKEQLPELPEENILAEPVNRNTAPSVAWAGVRIHRLCADARIIVVPSDQCIINEDNFNQCVLRGLDFVAANNIILTMGIRPTRPEPGYGYIQMGEPTPTEGISKVQSFTEKPEREFARLFMDSGEFLWNTGMFLANISYLREFFLNTIQDISSRLAPVKDMNSLDDELNYVQVHFPAYPNLSMDKASLEMSDNAYVMCCNFGWADVGTWHSIYEFRQRKEGDNVIIDSEVMIENCTDNIIKLPRGRIGVINGLDGYIVAEQGNVLLICKKGDSSSLIRKYVNEIGIRYGEEFT
ncbi:MAG: mannose-1-phosphate guanylyltransferase [Prevotella sp.]|nr:mannose-1-phosphate guanylyltransferase [Bacteroidales bacterium]MCR4810785.1 mannose-1-phosphate guanylyltransferase [Prevotella sp.]